MFVKKCIYTIFRHLQTGYVVILSGASAKCASRVEG